MVLPIKLRKGDPAPEDCVAVPLYGPCGEDTTWTWRVVANTLRANGLDQYCWTDVSKGIATLADAAAAPTTLRDGDKVQVGQMTGVAAEHLDEEVLIRWDDTDFGVAWLPSKAVTRINETEGDSDESE